MAKNSNQLPARIQFGSADRPRVMGAQLAKKPPPVAGEARPKGITAPRKSKPKLPKTFG